ncbi:MAG: hypothetical protein U0270_12475 [Labilithrix sp.]
MKASRAVGQAFGAGLVALLLLFPRRTQAEAVEEYERRGEMDDDGQRFGAIVVRGELVPSANAPGGWSLVRTYENRSDEAIEMALEEHVDRVETMAGARVEPPAVSVLARTQTLRLGPHEKRSIGTYLPEKLGREIAKARAVQAWVSAQMVAGKSDGDRTYDRYGVYYRRPLAPGETAAVREPDPDVYVEKKPARAPVGPAVVRISKADLL